MTVIASPQVSRRSFLASAAAAGGGLSLGFRIRFDIAAAQAADYNNPACKQMRDGGDVQLPATARKALPRAIFAGY
jgi:hypothetical protein